MYKSPFTKLEIPEPDLDIFGKVHWWDISILSVQEANNDNDDDKIDESFLYM